jgi:hypothetical protein
MVGSSAEMRHDCSTHHHHDLDAASRHGRRRSVLSRAHRGLLGMEVAPPGIDALYIIYSRTKATGFNQAAAVVPGKISFGRR